MNALIERASASEAEKRPSRRRQEKFSELVERLSRQSVAKHHDAYADITWDDEQWRIEPTDPRWELLDDGGLGSTAWYKAQPAHVRAALGLHYIAYQMKVSVQFESVLKRGLLEFAAQLPNQTPEFRYIYHEVIEEAQHALMFQEFVNRTSIDVAGMTGIVGMLSRPIVQVGYYFPELFLLFVLSGEEPIDQVSRAKLRSERSFHPLYRRIMQIHVTEEARHICFAQQYLKEHISDVGPLRMLVLRVCTPLILSLMVRTMLRPSPEMIRLFRIPRPVLQQAASNVRYQSLTVQVLERMHRLSQELGLVTPVFAKLWRALELTAPANRAG
jgi:hypothetical protein